MQSYIYLGGSSEGQAIQKEIGAELDYFSVNVELGVS